MDDQDREQELRALELALIGTAAALERLPAGSLWRPFISEARAALASTVGEVGR